MYSTYTFFLKPQIEKAKFASIKSVSKGNLLYNNIT